MSFQILETVEIKNGEGFLRINKRDFDPDKHILLDADNPVIKKNMPDRASREEELRTESWQTLKALAAALDPPITEKPDNGWDEVIPFILAQEFD